MCSSLFVACCSWCVVRGLPIACCLLFICRLLAVCCFFVCSVYGLLFVICVVVYCLLCFVFDRCCLVVGRWLFVVVWRFFSLFFVVCLFVCLFVCGWLMVMLLFVD